MTGLHRIKEDDHDDDASESSAFSNCSSTSSTSKTAGDGSSSEERRANYKEVKDFTRKETESVEMWRELVTGMLVIIASLLTCGTFIFLSTEETNTFKSSFAQMVVHVDESVTVVEKSLRTSLKAMSDELTSYGQQSREEWPFVTMPFFEIHGADAREAANLELISFCPLVNGEKRSEWESYSVLNQWWLSGEQEVIYTAQEQQMVVANMPKTIPEFIFDLQNGKPAVVQVKEGPYAPRWKTSPPPDPIYINFDVLSDQDSERLMERMVDSRSMETSGFVTEEHVIQEMIPLNLTHLTPHSFLHYPVFDSFEGTSEVVGFIEAALDWGDLLDGFLPEGDTGLHCVLSSSCGDTYTHQLDDGEIKFLGLGDQHDNFYSHMVEELVLIDESMETHVGHCAYTLLVYPSGELRSKFHSNIPAIFTCVMAAVFFVMAFFFFSYDKYVQARNKKVEKQAIKTNAIVASFFPKNIRDRSLDESGKGNENSGGHLGGFMSRNAASSSGEMEDKPIADLFPHCTVLYADIVGFTAWSSMREPQHVLLLLETIYKAFDAIAKRRKVFKVETIGDCYVAVTGLPEPMRPHALVMAKFAKDIMYKVHEVTQQLEVSLGPDTGDLSIRIGLHSGPVTAGILRGDRLRFQLFGDTVNTAARIESTGKQGCIHVSQETADQIKKSGKGHWLRERADKITAKGKGELTTFWLSLIEESTTGGDRQDEMDNLGALSRESSKTHVLSFYTLPRSKCGKELCAKTQRLVEWNVDVLHHMLRQIAATREAMDIHQIASSTSRMWDSEKNGHEGSDSPHMVLDEVQEVICLPEFSSKVAKVVAQATEAPVPPEAVRQLHDYVSKLASMYHDNPFHSFEHASHVTMSVVKLLSRIVAPAADLDYNEHRITDAKKLMKSYASKMHDHTYGITSDPLTQFSVVFAALIHDVDHLGLPNAQLVKEGTKTAKKHHGKSVAEQNLVDLGWEMLMQEDYEALRNAICAKPADRDRFRQLIVNSVMATDIVDKELKELRNGRWDKAFKDCAAAKEEDIIRDRNRKATIVIEHLIQASDVSHTMQHWHIYRKWNEQLFRELYRAYIEGRAEKDPSAFWHKGEIGFFQFYIIPLAKKLKDCGVFGVSSDEYLNYAEKNLAEWTTKGEGIVAEMIAKVKTEYGETPKNAAKAELEEVDLA